MKECVSLHHPHLTLEHCSKTNEQHDVFSMPQSLPCPLPRSPASLASFPAPLPPFVSGLTSLTPPLPPSFPRSPPYLSALPVRPDSVSAVEAPVVQISKVSEFHRHNVWNENTWWDPVSAMDSKLIMPYTWRIPWRGQSGSPNLWSPH